MKLNQEKIDFATRQIAYIDSDEASIFIENVDTENQVLCHVFADTAMNGVFFSCIYNGSLRVHIAFDDDYHAYNEEIASLLSESIQKSGTSFAMIWLRSENKKIIEHIKEKFRFALDDKSDYTSTEFIMRREHFGSAADSDTLEIRPYDEKHLDDYLLLLDEAMIFSSPPPQYRKRKEHCQQVFTARSEANSFEAFWRDDVLIGLYWRDENTISTMAVATQQQRKGYGTIILTRAIAKALQHTESDYAKLYAVGWNEKAIAFYRKYGMEVNGNSYLLEMKGLGE